MHNEHCGSIAMTSAQPPLHQVLPVRRFELGQVGPELLQESLA
ncbi:Hypothetical protein CAP_1918 [Chondromyces apiculatus DSM 436]|uniref:Uncharacterized protein n=1 Tax=Chondromyces apiculatus DSM 436 TaxID=1192034 RepID=A0A017TAS7_9BACT|nr:Hypothetical protein CAP_1918 [Chondromyces apiculatus DSM 436]